MELTPELLVDGLSPSQVALSADGVTPPKQVTDGAEPVEGPR